MALLKHPAIVLTAIIVFTILPIVLLAQWGANHIAVNERDYQIQQIKAVLSGIKHDTPLPPKRLPLEKITLAQTQIQALYPIYNRQKVVALLIHATALDGYNDGIELLLAYRLRQTRPAALRVLSHRETAGITRFLEADSAMQAFDGVSGATISAVAITDSAAEIEQWLQARNQWLMIEKQ